MKQALSFCLASILLFISLAPFAEVAIAQAKKTSSCENGECVEKMLERTERLSAVYLKECLPSNGKDIKSYHEKNGLTERCWKIITEINHLEKKLEAKASQLEAMEGCENGDCKLKKQAAAHTLTPVSKKTIEPNACNAAKKADVLKKCPSDMACVLEATVMGAGGYLAELLMPAKAKPKGCHLGDDSCLTQLATGFLKAAISFFEGAWDLLKMAGGAAGKKMGEFYDWVVGAEDHSSTSQLALAKASEDPGVFDMLLKDFPGTMGKIWTALVGSLKEWLKTDIFCQKWSGVPHFSQCVKPTDDFDCLPCKTMVLGLCAISGTIIAEVVPAFLTGGLTTAAKHGVNGAAKIAKAFKISSKGLKAIKASKLSKYSLSAATKIDDALRLSKALKATNVVAKTALSAIKAHAVKPSRKLIKESFAVLSNSMKKGSTYLVTKSNQKVLVFTKEALKTAGKVIIFPIENPMTAYAYKAGQRSFDTVLTLGAPKLAQQGAVVTQILSHEKELEKVLVKIEQAKLDKTKTSELLKLEEELLVKLEPKRRKILKEALENDDVAFEDIIQHLYPELQYGKVAKSLPAEKVLRAERDLFIEIEAMPAGTVKTALTKKYNAHVTHGVARSQVVGPASPHYQKILQNTELTQKARFDEALKLLKKEVKSPEQRTTLAKALEEAHIASPHSGVFEYSWRELREKFRILVDGGFTEDEAELLLRSGLAGRPPVRELVQPGATLFSGFADDILEGNYAKKVEELEALVRATHPQTAEKVLENLDSFYFIDYSHSAEALNEIVITGKKVDKATMMNTYNAQAFKNFQNTRRYLAAEKPEMNKEALLTIHKKMLEGGVADFGGAQDLGAIRAGGIMGNVPSGKPINSVVKNEILNNPYLSFDQHGAIDKDHFFGHILYPNVATVEKKTLDVIRSTKSDIVVKIEKFQANKKEIQTLQETSYGLHMESPEYKRIKARIEILRNENPSSVSELQKELVEALVDDLIDWFHKQRALLGKIDSPEKLDEYVNILAQYQRKLVSIHPLTDGNGRSTREFALSYALMKEGFPPPRILDPNADIYTPIEDWQKMIKHGILASDFLVDDMIERLKFGLPIENSSELLTPYTKPPVKMALKGEKKVPEMNGVEYIDPRLYREIVRRLYASDAELALAVKSTPLETWDRIHKKAEEVFAKNNIYFKHPKKGIERVEIGYVDSDFRSLYGKASSQNKELFDFKMKTWYSKDITWRGLASKAQEKSEDEIITMFQQMTQHNASNAVLRKTNYNSHPEAIRLAALEDFNKYNDDVFGEGLVKMAKDHSETGPMYGVSYGYSTSKSREVGKAFAMGAMVVGEYGSHRAPELQALLKSRVLVGARRANKDVDLGRLKQVREEFSYKYGRQQEVMGIGASDPDAITIVQTIDAQGEVIRSYLRNKNKPNEIFVVKGEIEADEIPGPEQLEKIIKLTPK